MHEQRFRFVAALLVAVLFSGITLVPAQGTIGAETSSIIGRVTAGDGKDPVNGATVIAYHLSSAEIYKSTVTLSNGKYEITGLPHGYYDVAVESADGLYVSNQVLNVPPDGKAVANLQLVPEAMAGEGPREFPGSEQEPGGIAQLVKKKKKGKAILIGVGGAAALAAAGGGSSGGGSPSPSQPPN
jgi:hypothetical protein